MSETSDYVKYDRQYQRMRNSLPDWEAALTDPGRYASRKPWLPERKDARILDFGCGWGHQLMALYCAGYRSIEGVEISQRQADAANAAACGRVNVVCMDGLEYVSARRAAYDAIVLNDVLEHIPTVQAVSVLEAIRLALKPGGTLAVRVPNASSLASDYSRYIDITHCTCFTEYSLMQLLDEAGFDDHVVVLDPPKIDRSVWRPWTPWRGLSMKPRLNIWLHRLVYTLRAQEPMPTVFGYNLEVYTHAPR